MRCCSDAYHDRGFTDDFAPFYVISTDFCTVVFGKTGETTSSVLARMACKRAPSCSRNIGSNPAPHDIPSRRGWEYSNGLDSEKITISKRNPPWPFLLVSKYWRELVLSTPFLWSTIVVVLTEYQCSHANVARVLPLVDAHLQRAKTSPLTLLITLREGSATRLRLEQGERDPVVPMFALFGQTAGTAATLAGCRSVHRSKRSSRRFTPHRQSYPSNDFHPPSWQHANVEAAEAQFESAGMVQACDRVRSLPPLGYHRSKQQLGTLGPGA